MKSIIIFDFMIKDLKLKGSVLLVYALIYSFCQFDQICFMKPESMANSLGLSRSQVFRAIDFLLKNGYILHAPVRGFLVVSNEIKNPKIKDDLAEMIRIAKTPWVY